MTGVEDLITLTKLELYDNQIEEITSIHNLNNLLILDLSFNAIREMIPNFVDFVPNLEELYLAQNKLRKIEGLNGLKQLKTLDLGANRIRVREETFFLVVSFRCFCWLLAFFFFPFTTVSSYLVLSVFDVFCISFFLFLLPVSLLLALFSSFFFFFLLCFF
jgi:hypothetical protein